MIKKKKKKTFGLIHLLTLFLIIYIVAVFWNQRNLMNALQVKKNDKILENKELEKEIRDLEKQIEDSQTLQFVEKVARDELGMIKPREIIFVDKNKNNNPFLKMIKKQN